MPPRSQTLPPAQTNSARAALQSFYCELCQKGYTRMNEYESHLSSYDHSHKQRLKDMKAMVRDPNAAARARKQEAKADGVISIKLGDTSSGNATGGGGFKKGGFKKAGFKPAFVPISSETSAPAAAREGKSEPASGALSSNETALANDATLESDTDDEGYEVYNPRFPTD